MNLQGDRTVSKRVITNAGEGARNVPEERDDSDESENDTSDDDTDPGTRRDFNVGVVQEVWPCIDS